jgi:putative transcriptional regulator
MTSKKRSIFDELMDGVATMKAEREGKVTLRHYKVEPQALPKVSPTMIKRIRVECKCSRNVFARKLFINERTLEKWEQGRAKPNPQAQALLLMASKYPDTISRLGALAK